MSMILMSAQVATGRKTATIGVVGLRTDGRVCCPVMRNCLTELVSRDPK